MNTPFKKILQIVAALALPAVATVTTASAQTQQNNQLALQLGAIQLGYTQAQMATNNQFLANALIQGQHALLATTTNKYTGYVATNGATLTNSPATNQPIAQSSDFRAELYQATLNALTSPVFNTNKFIGVSTIPVIVYNPKTNKFTTNKITSFGLNPALTTPSAVSAIVTARIPDLAPGLISNAVAATMMTTSGTNTNGVLFPIWGPQPSAASQRTATNTENVLKLNTKTATTQINNAAAVAKTSLTAAVKAYVSGTKQWAAVPKTGPATNAIYLPNFSDKPIGNLSSNQPVNLTGLADAAAAVAANAINGLGGINTNSRSSEAGLYGQSATNVTILTKALTQAAAAVQATSVKSGLNGYSVGAIGAETFGLITQVAGVTNSTWGNTATAGLTSILDGVVTGAVAAVGKTSPNIVAITAGVAQGFYADYIQTTVEASGTPMDYTAFVNAGNVSFIEQALSNAGVTTAEQAKLKITTLSITGYFQNVYNAYSTGTNGVWNYSTYTVAGAKGINLGLGTNVTPLLNGVGTPVTDTLGL